MLKFETSSSMQKKNQNLSFPYSEPPAFGELTKITDGIFWLRLALPMLIDHVNVYLLEDDDGLTLIDTGLNSPKCRAAWKAILRNKFDNKQVKRIVITHHHPDHIGLLGWFAKNGNVEVLASRSSWLLARMLYFDKQETPSREALDFWRNAGMDKAIFEEKKRAKPFNFSDGVSYFPLGFRSLDQGNKLFMGGRTWKVEIGQGHAPDHVTLWCLDSPIVFSGDQVIPGISSNLGVYPTEPLSDTVGLWLESCKSFLKIANEDQLVLPGHKLPFYGLPSRLKQLIENHIQALDRIENELSKRKCTAVDLFHVIFRRQIDKSEYGLALAEAVGHINYFRNRNMVSCTKRHDGAILFCMK